MTEYLAVLQSLTHNVAVVMTAMLLIASCSCVFVLFMGLMFKGLVRMLVK